MTSPAVDRYATMEKTKTTIAGPLGLGVNGVEAPEQLPHQLFPR